MGYLATFLLGLLTAFMIPFIVIGSYIAIEKHEKYKRQDTCKHDWTSVNNAAWWIFPEEKYDICYACGKIVDYKKGNEV